MNFNEIENIKTLLKHYNGNCSVLYPRIKDKIIKMEYSNEELPYMKEFLCFEKDYLLIKEFMLSNNIEKEIIDIGCQYGFQSELFLRQGYTGIDVYKHKFFNKDLATYIVKQFPKETTIDLKGKFVISNMSLSWFENKATKEEVIKELIKSDYLYFRGREKWKIELDKHYSNFKILNEGTEYLKNKDYNGVLYWK